MNENIKITIIIPVYNTEQYLRQCLDSIINQTFKDFECIFINDGSTDNSYNILKEYAQKDNRFTVVNLPENKGQGNARNEGLKIAKGKYITFIDSDDWVKENHIEQLYNSITKYNSDIVLGSFGNICRCLKKCLYNKIVKNSEDKKLLFLSEPVVSINFIIEKKFVVDRKILFPGNKRNEDFLFLFKIFANESKVVYINNKSYFYRINRQYSATTMFDNSKNCMELFGLFADVIDAFKQAGTFEIYKNEIYTLFLLLFCRDIIKKDLSKHEYLSIIKYFKDNFYQDNLYFLKTKKIRNKIRLSVFYFCLKYNINYTSIGRILKYINNIFCYKQNG